MRDGSESGQRQTATLEPKQTFQQHLNARAQQLGLAQIIEDGQLGRETHALATEVVWRLGLLPGREPLLGRQISPTLLALIADPAQRTAEQFARARRREWHLGSDRHRDLTVHKRGVRALTLLGDWDAWVLRRVEHVSMWPNDADVFVRKRTVDFTLPRVLHEEDLAGFDEPQREAARQAAELHAPPCAVPVTFAKKWRLPHFDIRDESGRTMPLVTRDEYGPLSVAMLVALAYAIRGYDLEGVEALPPMPREIEDELRAIVNEEPATAQTICNMLGSPAVGADTPAAERSEVLHWRQELATSQVFMELANEMARHFLLMAWYTGSFDERRVIKISYHIGGDPFAIEEIARDRLDAIQTNDWPAAADQSHPAAVGHLTISVACETLVVGTLTDAVPPECVKVRLVRAGEDPRGEAGVSCKLRAGSRWVVANLPVGSYQLHVEARKGFMVESLPSTDLEVVTGQRVRRTVTCRQLRPVPSPAVSSPDSWNWRLARALGLRSQQILFKIRMGEGGGYHFEFEAPVGMQVTRAKLVGARGQLDLNLRKNQQTHLYVPRRLCRPGPAHALVNIRPTGDVIVRSAALTAVLAVVAILAIALRWTITGDAGPTGTPLLLAVPGGLSAYVSQAGPSRVTDDRLFGIRMLALAPGLLAFAAAAIVLLADGCGIGLGLVWITWLLSVAVAVVLATTLYYAHKPPEQIPTPSHQGPGFRQLYVRT